MCLSYTSMCLPPISEQRRFGVIPIHYVEQRCKHFMIRHVCVVLTPLLKMLPSTLNSNPAHI